MRANFWKQLLRNHSGKSVGKHVRLNPQPEKTRRRRTRLMRVKRR
jgi:hypothetical protein